MQIIVHFYIYYRLMMEKMYKIKNQHFTFVRICNLPALLPNATPLVSRFFAKMSNMVYKGVFLKCAEILPTRLWDNVED
jgi:hypothetical protein